MFLKAIKKIIQKMLNKTVNQTVHWPDPCEDLCMVLALTFPVWLTITCISLVYCMNVLALTVILCCDLFQLCYETVPVILKRILVTFFWRESVRDETYCFDTVDCQRRAVCCMLVS